MTRTRMIFGWVLSLLAVAMPCYGAFGKFFSQDMQDYMASRGLEDWTTLIGIGELSAIILFVIPQTSKVGVLLLSALMGGAITLHMSNAEPFGMQSFVLVLAWVATFVRHPNFINPKLDFLARS